MDLNFFLWIFFRTTNKESGKITFCMSDSWPALSILKNVFHDAYKESKDLDPFNVSGLSNSKLRKWIEMILRNLNKRVTNWIVQVKDSCALSSREPGISNLKNMWNMIKTENKSFTELVTSNFPSVKEQEALVNELRHSGFLDVFEVSK